jgi:membrane-bound lytic murein transglycosylase MltF
LLIAQGYQESGLRQDVKSPVGAVGIMQLMPSTAAAPPISIPDIEKIEQNIHAGVKYLRHITDTYFDDPELSIIDRHLFAFAGYNAGPNRIQRLRRKAAEQGLDPNKWFNNVELVVRKHVGGEPTQYVRNIFKYYLAYRRIEEMQAGREAVRRDLRK